MRSKTALLAALAATVLFAGVGAGATATETAQPPNGTISHDGDRLTLAAGPGQEISGRTDLEPGTEVTVRIESEDPPNPFVIRPEATVDENGRFTAVVNLSRDEPGTNFTAELRSGGATLDEVDGQIVACDGDCEPVARTETPTHTPPSTDEAGMVSVVQVRQGETARIPISLGERDAVTVVIDGEDRVNYRINGTVRDGDGDGQAVVLFDTSAAGDQTPSLSTVGTEDTVEQVGPEPLLDGPLNATEYDMNLYPGGETEGDWITVGTLSIDEAATPAETPVTAGPTDSTTVALGPSTRATDPTPTAGLTTDDGENGGFDVGGMGALAAGGLLAIVGVGLLLGPFRS